MKVSNTQPPPPKVENQPKQAPVQAQQKVQTPPQAAAPQNPAHLGKSIDTKA